VAGVESRPTDATRGRSINLDPRAWSRPASPSRTPVRPTGQRPAWWTIHGTILNRVSNLRSWRFVQC